MSLKLIKSGLILAATFLPFLSACDKTEKEEENASVVNIEKGVASPIWSSEIDGSIIDGAIDPTASEAMAIMEEEVLENQAEENLQGGVVPVDNVASTPAAQPSASTATETTEE